MERYQNNIQDQFGNAISGVTVTVRRVSDGGLQSLFSDNSGTSKGNPFTNDNDGEFFFYAANNRYDIFLTGSVTDQKDDVILLDVITSGSSTRINTDIATATPPTTEAVTGSYQIYDLDNDDELLRLGFDGDNTLRLKNFMRGGDLKLLATDAGGNVRRLYEADPDGLTIIRGDTNVEIRVAMTGETTSELAIECVANGKVGLSYNNQEQFRTSDEAGADIGMGAEVRHNDGNFYPVGMNVLPEVDGLDSGDVTLGLANAGDMLTYNTGTNRELNFPVDANVPLGQIWSLLVGPSAGTLTGDGEATVQIRWWNGSAWITTTAAGNITIGEGRYIIWKETDTLYWIDGPTIS